MSDRPSKEELLKRNQLIIEDLKTQLSFEVESFDWDYFIDMAVEARENHLDMQE